ncbi:hypothetical protein F4805DRAFT_146462 [Annulohypoxylon moriforme]|nr:hypothetical protein F4805DRAFT_146462 [Annulohypoxylon moriforme]
MRLVVAGEKVQRMGGNGGKIFLSLAPRLFWVWKVNSDVSIVFITCIMHGILLNNYLDVNHVLFRSRVIEWVRSQRYTEGSEGIHVLYFYLGFENGQKGLLYESMLKTFQEQTKSDTNYQDDSSLGPIENDPFEWLYTSERDIYIIIDALDQLPSVSRYFLLAGLHTLAQKLKGKTKSGRLRVAISSRGCDGVRQLQDHNPFLIEVTAEKNKGSIEMYLEEKLKSELFQKEPELRTKVFDVLNEKANGMFLWVRIQVLNIREKTLKAQVLHDLRKLILPENMQDEYKKHAEEFESQQLDNIERKISQRTVALLAQGTGSISKGILVTAISLDDDGKIEPELFNDLNRDCTKIQSCCKYLVHINDDVGIIQFCHGSVFEFFRNYGLAIYNRRIGELCLSYLCSPDFDQGPQSGATWYNPGSLGQILQKHPFLPFASSRWASCVKKSFEPNPKVGIAESHSKILARFAFFFGDGRGRDKRNLSLALQVHFFQLRKTMPEEVCHEHIIGYFALSKFFDIFMKKKWLDLERLDSEGSRPIHWAIRSEVDIKDITDTVRGIIQYGANVNVKDKEGRTPLYHAAHCGNLEVTKLLVDSSAKIDITDENKETALIVACRKHHEAIIRYLVEAGADIKAQSSFGTALQAISLVGCCRCAKIILGAYKKSKIIENGGPFGSPLHAAAFYGHSDLVKLLCSRKIDVRARHRTYGTPITAALKGFNPGLDPVPFLEILQELIERGVDVNDPGGLLGPALCEASYQGNADIVALLLDHGAKIRKAKGPMGTAYEAARDRGHEEVLILLSKYDPKAADYAKHSKYNPQDRRKVQRKVFRATVKASSIESINFVIGQFERFFENEIREGGTPLLKGLTKLGEEVFLDVVELTTKLRAGHRSSKRQRFRDIISSLLCLNFQMGITDKDYDPALGEDGLGEHFPQVLDRLTQAAVKILEAAIVSNNRSVIRSIAERWADALNSLISHRGFGESMLETVVQKRADELKQYLTDETLLPEQRDRKAEVLALIGIELLLVTVERGPKFEHLAFVISKLWIRAVNDVDDLGEKGQEAIRKLIEIFVTPLSEAVKIQDPINSHVCAEAGVELMRAAVLNSKAKLVETFSKEWVDQWKLILEMNMQDMANEMMENRWKGFQRCFINGKHDEALGLALVGIEVLGASIKYESWPAASSLLPVIESGAQLVKDMQAYGDSTARHRVHVEVEDLECLSNALVNLFAIAEEKRFVRLKNLASTILDLANFASHECLWEIYGVIGKRIEESAQIVDARQREEQLSQIFRALVLFSDIALRAQDINPAVFSLLGKAYKAFLDKLPPNFKGRSELAEYARMVEERTKDGVSQV